jgi:hypothetical protein
MSQTHSNQSTTALEQLNLQRLNEAFLSVRKELLDQRGTAPHWTGQLSTSALSTATAISALSLIRKQSVGSDSPLTPLISRAAQWLYHHQNPDGGFGDTDRSHSNIATTLLVIAAWKLCEFESHSNLDVSQALSKAWSYVDRQGRWEGLRRRYGKDKTFVVPILSNCALAGLVPWSEVPALPFELAALPQAWYRFVKMPVVSYAIPALVAMGAQQLRSEQPARAAKNATAERRLSGSGSIDELCANEPRLHGLPQPPCRARGDSFLGRRCFGGWQLADRYKFGDLGHLALYQVLIAGALGYINRRCNHSLVAELSTSYSSSLYWSRPWRLGLDQLERSGAGCR